MENTKRSGNDGSEEWERGGGHERKGVSRLEFMCIHKGSRAQALPQLLEPAPAQRQVQVMLIQK